MRVVYDSLFDCVRTCLCVFECLIAIQFVCCDCACMFMFVCVCGFGSCLCSLVLVCTCICGGLFVVRLCTSGH